MKRYILLPAALVIILLFSCNDDNDKAYGTVVFGANYHVINCITNVDVFIDVKHIGQLETPADSVPDCDHNYGLREELASGHYNYKIEIRPELGIGCTKDITGELNITGGCCETVFIDYYEVFANE